MKTFFALIALGFFSAAGFIPEAAAQFTGGENDGTDSDEQARRREGAGPFSVKANPTPATDPGLRALNMRGGFGENSNDLLGTGIRPSTGTHVANRRDRDAGSGGAVITPTHGSNVTG